jgi:hypothetical protein
MRSYALIAALFIAEPSFAEDMIDPGRIAAATTGDFDKDGDADLAVILRPPQARGADDNGVYIYLADPGEGRMILKVAAPNLVPNSFIYAGESVAITSSQNGSIVVTAKNDTPGQRHYEIKLTVAYRNSDFLVAGYSLKENVPHPLDCDLNMLTGKGLINGKPFTGVTGAILLTEWSDDIGRQACRR